MAITIDYSDPAQYVIQVPKADTILLQTTPAEIRSLDLNAFRLELSDLQDEAPDIWASTAFFHTPPLTISGVTLARVVEILDPYTIEFEDGLYSVNIVGGNSNLADVTIKNQVGVNTANSAGLQDPFSLQAAAFAGGVAVKPSSGFSGTSFPVGTRSNPVDNIADAHLIAGLRGLNTFFIMESITLATENLDDGYVFIGDNPVTVTITIDPAAGVENAIFENATVAGTLDGANSLRGCHIQNINVFNGAIHECSLEGTITLGGTEKAEIYDSWSGIPGGGVGATAEIDMVSAAGQDMLIRNYSGGLDIVNCAGDSQVSIDMSSGRVVLENTVTDGDFWIRGVGDVFDGSAGTATVQDLTLNKGQVDAANSVIGNVWAARPR